MSVHRSFARRGVWLLLGFLLVVAPAGAAESGKITLYETKEIFWKPARSLASSFEMLPLPAQGAPQHGFLIDGSASSTLGDSVALIKQGYEAGLPLVIVAPAADAQGFVDDITGGDVDLPAGLTR